MTEPPVPKEPDWTARCFVHELDEIGPGNPYMLRTSDDSASPWRMVKSRHQGWWTDEQTGVQFEYTTVEFHRDEAQRILNHTDEIEVGLIRPPWWPTDMEPPVWPKRE
ncbi:hypothetical protein [Mycobacterium sp. Root265]|uniref:hypothetical protein n=1 Tax=Mycobacterium sp. Root265 TaxID=1736504 RepID=UPI000A887B8E|nr:hypothetical protein [Mycobacterium sp. Root265]